MLNSVNLIGRLTRDPELRTTSTGKSVCDFSIAVQKTFKPQDGSPDADFFRVQCWERTANFVCDYLGKGRLVSVEGRLSSRKYTTADGQQREVVEVVATGVQSLDRPKEEGDGDRPGHAVRPTGQGVQKVAAPCADEYDPFADE